MNLVNTNVRGSIGRPSRRCEDIIEGVMWKLGVNTFKGLRIEVKVADRVPRFIFYVEITVN
jgi:hypothetical protein